MANVQGYHRHMGRTSVRFVCSMCVLSSSVSCLGRFIGDNRRFIGDNPGGGAGDAGASPNNMILIEDFAGGAFWIDAYEASLSAGVLGSEDQDLDDDGRIADETSANAHASSHGLVADTQGEDSVELTTVQAVSMPGVLPTTNVSFYQSASACANAGKRLCTSAEWYHTCAGAEGRIYPYGDTWDRADELSIDCWGGRNPSPTGAFGCVTPEGVFDLSGNVWEWTNYRNPLDAELKGGSSELSSFRVYSDDCDATWALAPASVADDPTAIRMTGFRCCKDP